MKQETGRKLLGFLLTLVLLLGLFTVSASAQTYNKGYVYANNLNVGDSIAPGILIIYMDGIPVVMETLGLSMSDSAAYDAGEGFTLPAALAEIGEEAFAGIDASRVEITANVTAIGPRAFAECENLRELIIPGTVQSIDDSALDGSANATVYGESGSEAQRFAETNGIPFVPTNPETPTYEAEKGAVVLPFVAF